MRAIVILDGGYLYHFTKSFYPHLLEGRDLSLNYGLLGSWAAQKAGATSVDSIHYYNALPPKPHLDDDEEDVIAKNEAITRAQQYYRALKHKQAVTVHASGHVSLQYCSKEYNFANPNVKEIPWKCKHEYPKQKLVDVEMSLMIAEIAYTRPDIDLIVLFTGDLDLVPACKLALSKGKAMFFVHGDEGLTASYYYKKPDQYHLKIEKQDLAMFRWL